MRNSKEPLKHKITKKQIIEKIIHKTVSDTYGYYDFIYKHMEDSLNRKSIEELRGLMDIKPDAPNRVFKQLIS